MQNKIIIANWKMNGSFDEAQNWIEKFSKKIAQRELFKKPFPKIVVCPPAIMIDYIDGLLMEKEFEKIETLQKNNVEDIDEAELEKMVANLRKVEIGGQDCAREEKGAFTGDVSAFMLKDAGCEYVILGHSERRQYHSESNEIVAQKISQAIAHNLTPILCIGEARESREKKQYADFICKQLENSLPENLKIRNLVIAYEPIWSIGTGLVPTVAEIEEVANLIKNEIAKNKNIGSLKVIYGGSVKKENAGEILNTKNIDGLLVGGASLVADDFFAICVGE